MSRNLRKRGWIIGSSNDSQSSSDNSQSSGEVGLAQALEALEGVTSATEMTAAAPVHAVGQESDDAFYSDDEQPLDEELREELRSEQIRALLLRQKERESARFTPDKIAAEARKREEKYRNMQEEGVTYRLALLAQRHSRQNREGQGAVASAADRDDVAPSKQPHPTQEETGRLLSSSRDVEK